MTGTNFSSWYSQSQGTMYGEISVIGLSINGVIASTNDTTSNNDVRLRALSGSSILGLRVNVNGIAEATLSSANAFTVNQSFKLAGFYQVNNFGFTSNGNTVLTDTVGVLPIATQLQLGFGPGASVINGTIKRFIYYPVALTPTQLQGLTS